MYISAVKVDILTGESMGTSQPLVATEGTAVFFLTFNLVFIHLCLILSEVHLTTRTASAVEIQPSKHLPYISMT